MEPPLPTKCKVAYGFANMGNGALSGIAIGGALSFFYNVKMGLDYSYVSLAWLLFAAWNAINDPLFGIIEDRTRSKIGRHIPYIRYGAPIYGVLFILTWFPFGVTQLGLFFNLLIMLFLVDTIYTMIGLVTYSLPAEMTLTAKGRSELLVYSTFIGAIGLVISNLIPILLLTGDRSPVLNPLFQPAMIVLGIVCSFILWGSSYFLKENEFAQLEEPMGIIEAIKETVKNKAFVILEVGLFALVLGQYTIFGSIYYVIDYVLKLKALGDYFVLVPLVFAFVGSVFLTQRLVVKYGVKKTFIFGLVCTGGGLIATFFAGGVILVTVITLCPTLLGLAALLLTNQSVFGDVVDSDEVKTGKRRETTYSGINALFTKPAVSLATAMFLAIAGAFGFDPDMTVQVPTVTTGILAGFGLVPGILLLLSALVMLEFPLDGPEWLEQKQRLVERHLQKEQEYLAFVRQKQSVEGGAK